jgi:plastocyanin
LLQRNALNRDLRNLNGDLRGHALIDRALLERNFLNRHFRFLDPDQRRDALVARSVLRRNLLLSGWLYATAYNPYLAMGPYFASGPSFPGGNTYVTQGAGSGNSMLAYAILGYGTQAPSGSNYGSANTSGYPPSYGAPAPAPAPAPAQKPYATTSTGAIEEVNICDGHFKPGVMVVPAGTTVVWTNNGQQHHTVKSYAGLWDSGDLRPGASYSVTFTEPGVYYYFCASHPREMRGLVQVTGSASNGSPSYGGSTAGY